MSSCNDCNKCDKCGSDPCACPKPVLEVSRRDSDSLVLRFNINGVTTEYDFAELIHDGETDTSIGADLVKRALKFVAEKHIDSMSAAELGSILHLNDIGDVSSKNAQNGSSLVYKKDSGCPAGCVGTSNQWHSWNALDNIVSSAEYLSVYEADGYPKALGRPTNTNQFYMLGWHGSDKISYRQPRIASVKGAGDYTLYMDKTTKEIYGVL